MELSKAVQMTRDVEEKFSDALNDLTEKTGLVVMGVDFTQHDTWVMGGPQTYMYTVKLKVGI